MAIPQFPQNSKLQPQTQTGTKPVGTNTKLQAPKHKTKPSVFVPQDSTTSSTLEKQKENIKKSIYTVAGSTTKKLGSKSKSSPNYLKQTYDFVNDLKTKYDNSVKGEGFRNLNGNSTVDALYQVKDVADGADSFINKSHGGRKALAKLDSKMNSSKFANNYNKLRSPLSKTYHATKDKVATIKGKFKAPFKSIQGKITAGTKYLKGKATSGFKVVKGFVKSSKSTAALKSASSSTKTLSILGKMKNLNLVKRTGKLLNKCNDFVQLVSSGAKTSSKWVKGVRFVSSSAKVAGRACWVAAIGINCYEVYDAFKKGGVKAAAPKAIQCATETACAWGGAKIGAAIGSAFGPFGALVGGAVGGLAGYFIGSKAGKYVIAGAKKLWNGAKKLWNGGKKLVGKAINTGKKLIKGAINTGKKVINGAKNVAKKAWNSAKSFVKSLKFW